jgi:hypothetical protein
MSNFTFSPEKRTSRIDLSAFREALGILPPPYALDVPEDLGFSAFRTLSLFNFSNAFRPSM